MPLRIAFSARPVRLITGATDGVGKATALGPALEGFEVVIAARNAVGRKERCCAFAIFVSGGDLRAYR